MKTNRRSILNLSKLTESRNNRSESAVEFVEQAILNIDHDANALNNYGAELLALQQYEAAVESFDRAIELKPDLSEAHYNRGIALHKLNHNEAALESYVECIALSPNDADAYYNCGLLLRELKQLQLAAECFGKSILLTPDNAIAYNNLGIVLQEANDLSNHDEVTSCFAKAIELKPDYAEAYSNLGFVLQKSKKFKTAEQAYRRALEIVEDYGHAAGQAYKCALSLCDWRHKSDDEALLAEIVQKRGGGIPVFNLLLISNPAFCSAPKFQREAAKLYSEAKYAELSLVPLMESASLVRRNRLRVGYLSSDFHEHATMVLLQGVLAAHDRTRFEIYAYHYGTTVDLATLKAKESIEFYRDVSTLSNTEAAKCIAADDLDILVDLKGYTENTRLEITALRPAPVIVNWLGYPGTLGHPRLADYIIGDRIVTPPEHAEHFSETLALMPHCYQPNDRERKIADRPSRLDEGLPESGFVFCSFNQSYKFDPDTFCLWCELLKEIPGSVLWLLAPTEPAIVNLRQEALTRGISPDRIVFAAERPVSEHLGRLQLADLALDTFPVTSHTTASDALWAGVPLVTRIGDSFVSRVAASLLNTLGLDELVTYSGNAYFTLAKELAQDPTQLSEIRQKLIANRLTSPLFDTQRFTIALETIFDRIWEQQSQGKREIIMLAEVDLT